MSSEWLYECSHRNSNHSRPHNDGHHHWQQTPHTTRAPPTPSFLQGPTLDQKWKWTQSLCNHNQWSHPWCSTQCSFPHNISQWLKSDNALAFLSADGERGSFWCSKNSRKLWCQQTTNHTIVQSQFNQLNKFIGKEMMAQAEAKGLVGREAAIWQSKEHHHPVP